MSRIDNALPYRLARTMVVVEGTVVRGRDPLDPEQEAPPEATSDVKLAVEADPNEWARYSVDLGRDSWRDRELDLHVAPDGRLSKGSGTETGAGPAVLEAGIRLVGTAIGTATTLGGLARGILPLKAAPRGGGGGGEEGTMDAAGAKPTLDDLYAEAFPNVSQRRTALREAMLELQSDLANLAKAASDGDATTRRNTLREIPLAAAALDTLRDEAGRIETHFEAWVARRTAATEEKHSFTLPTTDLPRVSRGDGTGPATLELSDADLGDDVAEVARTLNVAIVSIEDTESGRQNDHSPPGDDTPQPGVYFRMPRRLRIGVYETSDPPGDGKRTFTRRTITDAWVVDTESQVGYVDFDSSFFNKRSAAVEFGAAGGISRVTTSETSAAGAVAGAISAAPKQLQESLDAVGKVAEGIAKARSFGTEQRIADLERQKKEKEAKLAVKDAPPTSKEAKELAKLNAAVERVKALRQLGTDMAQLEAAGEKGDVDELVELARLQVALLAGGKPGAGG